MLPLQEFPSHSNKAQAEAPRPGRCSITTCEYAAFMNLPMKLKGLHTSIQYLNGHSPLSLSHFCSDIGIVGRKLGLLRLGCSGKCLHFRLQRLSFLSEPGRVRKSVRGHFCWGGHRERCVSIVTTWL